MVHFVSQWSNYGATHLVHDRSKFSKPYPHLVLSWRRPSFAPMIDVTSKDFLIVFRALIVALLTANSVHPAVRPAELIASQETPALCLLRRPMSVAPLSYSCMPKKNFVCGAVHSYRPCVVDHIFPLPSSHAFSCAVSMRLICPEIGWMFCLAGIRTVACHRHRHQPLIDVAAEGANHSRVTSNSNYRDWAESRSGNRCVYCHPWHPCELAPSKHEWSHVAYLLGARRARALREFANRQLSLIFCVILCLVKLPWELVSISRRNTFFFHLIRMMSPVARNLYFDGVLNNNEMVLIGSVLGNKLQQAVDIQSCSLRFDEYVPASIGASHFEMKKTHTPGALVEVETCWKHRGPIKM